MDKKPEIEFIESSHEYYVNGVRMPSVTQIIEDSCNDLSMIPKRILADACARGTIVHKLTELDDYGTLDEDSIDAELAGYLDSWRCFIDAYEFDLELIEHRVYCPRYKYVGTFDRYGTAKIGRRKERVLIDIKSGMPRNATAVQLAAYTKAFEREGSKVNKRLGVYLRKDGGLPNVQICESPSDYSVFIAMNTVFHWKNPHWRIAK